MVRFEINPLWCCSVMPDGEMAAKAGGYTDFIGGGGGIFGDNDASIDATISAMVQSIAQEVENTGQSAIDSAEGSWKTIRSGLLWSNIKNIIFPPKILNTAITIGVANRNLSKAKNALAAEIGKDRADAVFADIFKGFNAEHATDISPEGELSEQDFNKVAIEVYGFDPATATQDQKDRYMVEQYYKSKAPGMTGKDFDDWVDQEVQNVQGGRYRFNRSQEMGVPEWYKQYLRANNQAIPGGVLGNDDPATMGDTGGDTVADNQKIIKDAYKDFLGWDSPGEEAMAYWQGRLDSGDVTASTLPDAIIEMAGEGASPVNGLYKKLFGVDTPDGEGLGFWNDIWRSGEYSIDELEDLMADSGRRDWTTSPGGTEVIHNATGGSNPLVQTRPDATIPDNIPENLQPGFEGFVDDSWDITNQYRQTADQLWSDYLDFEKTYFGKYEDNQNRYQANLDSMPQMNLQMPGTMGGATVPLAPKVHSAMYTDQFNAMNSGIGNQANASLAGLGSRDSLAKNIFATNLNNLQNSFLPTQAGMDLYQMERAGQLGINQAEAGRYEPSTLSTWAPVVGSLLQSDFGSSAIDGLWDTGSGLVRSGWDFITGLG